MALTQIKTSGIADDAITADKLPTNLDLLDNQNIRFGTGNDFYLYHNGTDSFIKNITGDLKIFLTGGTEETALFKRDGAVELFYDASKKLETTSTGIAITGGFTASGNSTFSGTYLDFADDKKLRLGTSGDLELYHSGGANFIRSESTQIIHIMSDGSVRLQKKTGSENMLVAHCDGGVELYYDNVKKLQTNPNGIHFNAAHTFHDDSYRAKFGAGDDLYIYHDGTNSYVTNITGDLYLRCTGSGDDIYIVSVDNISLSPGDENGVNVQHEGTVELYYDNAKKLETTSTGVTVSGNVDVGSNKFVAGSVELTQTGLYLEDADKIYCGTGDDLQLFHNGTSSQINDSSGSIYIQSDEVNIRSNTGGETMFKGTVNGAVELYYNDTKQFETVSGGVKFIGKIAGDDNQTIDLGTGADLKLYFDGTNSIIDHTSTSGTLYLRGDALRLQTTQSTPENYVVCSEGGPVELYHNNTKRFETTSSGVSVPISSSSHGASITTTGDVYPQITLGANRSSENNSLGYTVARWNGTDVAAIDFVAGPDTTNKDDGKIGFNTRPSGGSMLRRMTIDSNGYVTTPKQPAAFYTGLSNSQSNNATDSTEVLKFSNAKCNEGNHYDTSNGRFTVPVSGTYFIGHNCLIDDNASDVARSADVRKNGNGVFTIWYDESGGDNDYHGVSGTGILELSANDYIEIRATAGVHVGNETGFCVYLLG